MARCHGMACAIDHLPSMIDWTSPALFSSAGPIDRTVRLELDNGRIAAREVLSGSDGEYLLLPELTNSHDHLEFNLYPRLGSPPYSDYHAWGEHIHATERQTIEEIEAIPLGERRFWGLIKNLVNGFTRVVNHGPARIAAFTGGNQELAEDLLPEVIDDFRYIHSPGSHRGWRRSLWNILDPRKVVVHLGEGTTQRVYRDAQAFFRWNIFGRPIFAVHGLSMPSYPLAGFIWCPGSNIWLYGEAATIPEGLRPGRLLFGSDSTLSGSASIWDHLRTARDLDLCSDRDLFEALTVNACRAWGAPTGGLAVGDLATFLIVRRNADGALASLFATGPEDVMLVVKDGRCLLADAAFADRSRIDCTGASWCSVTVGGAQKRLPFDILGSRACIEAQAPAAQFPLVS